MKIRLLCVILYFISFKSFAQDNECKGGNFIFKLNEGSAKLCESLIDNSKVTITLCQNESGYLYKDQKIAEILFKYEGEWLSRTLSANFTEGIFITKEFHLSNDLKSFMLIHIVETNNQQTQTTKCSGRLLMQ